MCDLCSINQYKIYGLRLQCLDWSLEQVAASLFYIPCYLTNAITSNAGTAATQVRVKLYSVAI